MADIIDINHRFYDPALVMLKHEFLPGDLNGRHGWVSMTHTLGLVFHTTSSGAWQSINAETGGMVEFGDTAKELDAYVTRLKAEASK